MIPASVIARHGVIRFVRIDARSFHRLGCVWRTRCCDEQRQAFALFSKRRVFCVSLASLSRLTRAPIRCQNVAVPGSVEPAPRTHFGRACRAGRFARTRLAVARRASVSRSMGLPGTVSPAVERCSGIAPSLRTSTTNTRAQRHRARVAAQSWAVHRGTGGSRAASARPRSVFVGLGEQQGKGHHCQRGIEQARVSSV